jgi:NitT/TauT family transport system substrate-binding protein
MKGLGAGAKRFLAALMAAALLLSAGPLQAGDSGQTLAVALLPILDVLPFYVAREKGYFNHPDITIKAVAVGSALERDQLLQAGQIDGVLNEMTTVAGFNRDRVRVRIVATARRPFAGHPLFRILSPPGSPLTTVAALAGKDIAVSINTIIEYAADRILARSGLAPGQFAKKNVPVIAERYQLLMQGKIAAAMIPDPLAHSAAAAGAIEILNDTGFADVAVSVLTFTVEALETKTAAVRLLVSGWDRAAADINDRPEAFRDLMLSTIRVPENNRRTCPVPVFPRSEVPTPAQWQDVVDWMQSKGLVDKTAGYAQAVKKMF